MLGVLAGMWFGGGRGPGAAEVTVPGALSIRATCGDTVITTSGEALWIPVTLGPCTLRADLPGGSMSTVLDAGRSRRYRCAPQKGDLVCTGR